MNTLTITQQAIYDFSSGLYCRIIYTAVDADSYQQGFLLQIGSPQDLTVFPPIFENIESAFTYYQGQGIAQGMLNQINSDAETTLFDNYKIITLPIKREISNPSRTLNNIFQINAFRDALVSYSVDGTGDISLQYADNSGFSTNVVTVQSGNSTGTVALFGFIPAGKFVQLVTGGTFTVRNCQETIF